MLAYAHNKYGKIHNKYNSEDFWEKELQNQCQQCEKLTFHYIPTQMFYNVDI